MTRYTHWTVTLELEVPATNDAADTPTPQCLQDLVEQALDRGMSEEWAGPPGAPSWHATVTGIEQAPAPAPTCPDCGAQLEPRTGPRLFGHNVPGTRLPCPAGHGTPNANAPRCMACGAVLQYAPGCEAGTGPDVCLDGWCPACQKFQRTPHIRGHRYAHSRLPAMGDQIGHDQRKDANGCQICCGRCHQCGTALHVQANGMMYCEHCTLYR